MKKKQPRRFVTYGIYYDPGKFQRPKTAPLRPANKPHGGLWSSPIDSPISWKEWCTSEGFRIPLLRFGTRFNLIADAKILTLDSIADLISLPRRYWSSDTPLFPLFRKRILDYEALMEDGYQAIHLTADGVRNLRWDYDLPPGFSDFYGWDCETMLILDPSIIRDVKYFGSQHSLKKSFNKKNNKKAHS